MAGRSGEAWLRGLLVACALAKASCEPEGSDGGGDEFNFTVDTLKRPKTWQCEMLRLELKYEFEAVFVAQARQVRIPKIWDAFPKQKVPFSPELLVESLEVADARCPGAVFPWCVWNIVENWRYCGALFAQLLSDNRTDVLHNERPSTWRKTGWKAYEEAWEACPARCMGVLAQLSSPSVWMSAKKWPIVAAVARLESWWHVQTLSMPFVGMWYYAQLFPGPLRRSITRDPEEVPPVLADLLLKARVAGTAMRKDLLSTSTLEAALSDNETLLRELAPWPQALHGRGAICSPMAMARTLAAEDAERTRISAGARSAAGARAATVDLSNIADRSVHRVAKCLIGHPRRSTEWFVEGLPVFGMLERVTLPMFATTRTNSSTTVPGAKTVKSMVASIGRAHSPELLFLLKPGRDVVSDKQRHDGTPACWQQGMFRGVAKIAVERPLTPERPLRLIEVGAASGDCHMQVLAVLGPSRAKALVLEPFPPVLERLRRNLALNGLEGAVEVRAQGLGARSERIPLCGDPRNDVSLFFTKCGEGEAKFAEIEAVSLADLLDSSGEEFWDVLSIAPQILEGCPEALHSVRDLDKRVRYISSGSCLISAHEVVEKGLGFDAEEDCHDL